MDQELELPSTPARQKGIWPIIIAVILILAAGIWWNALRPAGENSSPTVTFEVRPGEGFGEIAADLSSAGLIRSKLAFEMFALVDGVATSLQPGLYELSPAMSGSAIARALSDANGRTTTVTIPEGSNVYQIDKLLSDALIIHAGDLVAATKGANTEGMLFPDTYQFLNGESTSSVIKKFTDNFGAKVQPLFARETSADEAKVLTLASILEKEVPTPADQRIVAGIMEKRLAAGIALDVDATVCYGKQVANPGTIVDCATLTSTDLKSDTPYNTYLHKGLPPSPIGNPGTSTIEAALNPTASPYWYYLSDPATGKTIYAKTLDEQNANIRRYLR